MFVTDTTSLYVDIFLISNNMAISPCHRVSLKNKKNKKNLVYIYRMMFFYIWYYICI